MFVDPVGTGYSQALGEKKDKEFWGYDEDADSVAEFIRTFITTHNRWNSPKYILGESYGGIRSSHAGAAPAAATSASGSTASSSSRRRSTWARCRSSTAGNDLSYATHLPALAATAYYHKKLPDQWPSLRGAAAGGRGLRRRRVPAGAVPGRHRLARTEKERVAERLHRYTGVSKEYILRSDLRIYAQRFIKELLRDEGKSVGLLDGRYTQDELDDVAAFPDGDPFSAKTGPIYVAAFQSYLRNDLEVDLAQRYVARNEAANGQWKRPRPGRRLRRLRRRHRPSLAQGTKDNEALRVFSAAGYHDLTTSYFATSYMLRHSGIDAGRMTIKDYEGGHMMYLYQPSLEALSNDVVSFIQGK